MEPRIIDYYNEMPHSVNVIEKMNEELNELQKKYDELQGKYDKLKNPNHPTILFENWEEYDLKHDKMYQRIRDVCEYYFNDFEYTFMKNWGITPRQSAHLTFTIENELKEITNDTDFSHINSYKIMKPITWIFNGERQYWNKIYNSFTKEELKEIFIENIKSYIEEKTRPKYARFKCNNCGKIDDYISYPESLCDECED